MKKLFVALTMMMFLGSVTATAYAATIGSCTVKSCQQDDKDKKDCKKEKGCCKDKKECSKDKKEECKKGDDKKCCSKDKKETCKKEGEEKKCCAKDKK
jgi:hypothetical protein